MLLAIFLSSALPGSHICPQSHEFYPAMGREGVPCSLIGPAAWPWPSLCPIPALGWRGQGQPFCPSPQPPDWLPAQESGCPSPRRVSGALQAPPAAQMAAGVCGGAWPSPASRHLPSAAAGAHPGEGAWREGVSEVLTSQTHSCCRAASCVCPEPGPLGNSCHGEARTETCSMTDPERGLCPGKVTPTLPHLWIPGVRNTLLPPCFLSGAPAHLSPHSGGCAQYLDNRKSISDWLSFSYQTLG